MTFWKPVGKGGRISFLLVVFLTCFLTSLLFISSYSTFGFGTWGQNAPRRNNNSYSASTQRSTQGAQWKYAGRMEEPLMINYIHRNEEVRKRFLKKREKFLKLWWSSSTIWEYFQPTFTCPHPLERVGSTGDGGKWICGINVFEETRKDCVVYSFGVDRDSTFEMEILERTNCEVFAFDPTVNGMNLVGLRHTHLPRVHFFKQGLGGMDNKSQGIFTLGHFMRENKHSWIDFLKIDIEAGEFPAFRQIAREFGENFPFGHLNVEVHLHNNHLMLKTTGEQDRKEYEKLLGFHKILENGGLRVFMCEVNLGNTIHGGRPSVMEFSLVNIKDQRNKMLHL